MAIRNQFDGWDVKGVNLRGYCIQGFTPCTGTWAVNLKDYSYPFLSTTLLFSLPISIWESTSPTTPSSRDPALEPGNHVWLGVSENTRPPTWSPWSMWFAGSMWVSNPPGAYRGSVWLPRTNGALRGAHTAVRGEHGRNSKLRPEEMAGCTSRIMHQTPRREGRLFLALLASWA